MRGVNKHITFRYRTHGANSIKV